MLLDKVEQEEDQKCGEAAGSTIKTRIGRKTRGAILNNFGAVRRRFWVGTERPEVELRRGALVIQKGGRNSLDRR